MIAKAYNSNNYRYGFNGHEKDDEISGSGNHLSFGDYGYDTRLGRRWNIDPESASFPGWSPYMTHYDSPIAYLDADGRNPLFYLVYLAFAATLYDIGEGTHETDLAMQAKARGDMQGYTQHKAQSGEHGKGLMMELAGGAVFKGLGMMYRAGKPIIQVYSSKLIKVSDIFSNSIATRGVAEKFALLTKYKGFKNINDVIPNNKAFDLYDEASSTVVDITTTAAQKLSAGQFYTKLSNLGDVAKFKNKQLQIFVEEGKYSADEIKSLTEKLTNYVKDFGLDKKGVSFSIDAIKDAAK